MFLETLYVSVGILCVCVGLLLYGAFHLMRCFASQKVETKSSPVKLLHEELNKDDLCTVLKTDEKSIIDKTGVNCVHLREEFGNAKS